MSFITLSQQQHNVSPVVPEPGLGLKVGDRGCDVSSYQPNVDWQAYATSGRKWVFIKATEGTSYVNPYFQRGWLGAKLAGVLRGTYHFARPDLNAPEREAAWFLEHVPLESADMLALDLEDGQGDLFWWAWRFLDVVAAQAGRKAYFYSGLWFMQPHNLCRTELDQASAGLWYASYEPEPPRTPPGWEKITFWQHTSSAMVPGIPGGVDESIFLG